jgi:23S rRNA pseudouridine1911/1915/1917 synthase
LDVYLAQTLEEGPSRSRVQRLIRDGRVRVEGEPAKPSRDLTGGESIVVEMPSPAETEPLPESIPLDILYEDDDLLVVNKPAGMVVHPGAGVDSGTLVNAALHHCVRLSTVGGPRRPGIVHRLDRLTTGCICVAKTDLAHQGLAAQLLDRTMSRVYLAWAVGEMQGREGRIDAPIGRSPRNPTRMAVVRHAGRPAATRWEVLARAPGLTRLRCRLETGRTHQIRVHLAHVNHPVVGDADYGLSLKEIKMRIPAGHPAVLQAAARCERQMLHAHQLRFIHPRTGRAMEFEAPLPEDFRAFEAALERLMTP